MLITFLIIILITAALPLKAYGLEEPAVSQYLDKTLTEMTAKKAVKGAVVSVVKENNTVLSKGYGFADDKNGIAADYQNTAFRIGSISKTFVAVAAQQLAQKGKLDMNTSVSKYLESDFPKFKYDITMNNLLTHTAGFEDMISGIAVYDIRQALPLSLSVRKYMPNQVFTPGEIVSYSNYGIGLAAYIIERIAEEDFYRYVDENIFKPLGMTKTSFELDFDDVTISKAYTTKGEEAREPLINFYPEGSVISTADDMSKYMMWLMDNSDNVLTAEAKHQIFNQHFTNATEFEGMGYTWNRKESNGVLYYDKKGESVNFFSRIVIYPQQKTGVFLSFNTYVDEKELDGIMDHITSLILGQEKQYSPYTGEQTADISGYYVTTFSNFEHIEKFLNLLVPGRIIHISGSLTSGFKMNGNKLLPLGENYYSTPIGNLKLVKKSGRSYLASNTATSYLQTNWYESSNIQKIVLAFFIVTSFTMLITGIFTILRRKSDKMNYFLGSLSIIHFALFVVLCISLLNGISDYSLIDMTPSIKIYSKLITLTSGTSILFTVYLFIKRIFKVKNIPLIFWNIANMLFCLWMIQVNIL